MYLQDEVNILKNRPKSKHIFEFYHLSVTKDKMEWENYNQDISNSQSESENESEILNRCSEVIMRFYN